MPYNLRSLNRLERVVEKRSFSSPEYGKAGSLFVLTELGERSPTLQDGSNSRRATSRDDSALRLATSLGRGVNASDRPQNDDSSTNNATSIVEAP